MRTSIDRKQQSVNRNGDKRNRSQCENQNFKRKFETQEQLTSHEHQHEQNANYHTIYNLDPEGKADRRK